MCGERERDSNDLEHLLYRMGHKQYDTKLLFLVLMVNWAEEIQKVSGCGKWTSICPSGHAATFMGSTGHQPYMAESFHTQKCLATASILCVT